MIETVQRAIHIGPQVPAERSIGWEILGWAKKYLLQPDGPNAGEPWDFTDEQALFVTNWYAVDEHGRFTYRYAMFRRMKGHGKDPFAAALCCAEFVGPCRFDRFVNGVPVAKQHPAAWIQAAAVNKDQTRNLMTIFPAMFSPQLIKEFGIDLGKEIIYAERGKRRIEAVTSSPRALEGGRATFIVKDESQHWLAPNEGHEMAKVIARNAAKSRDGASRVLAISNAHAPGEDSDAEHDYETWQKIDQGLSTVPGFLYDSLEAPDTDLQDDESVKAGLKAAIGDSHWLDPVRLLAEIRDPRTSPAVARRFYLNQIVAEEDKPFDRARWAELARPGYMPKDGALITLGFDGSISRDHTALIATEVATGHQWVAGYWEPRVDQNGDVRIPLMEVVATVEAIFERYQVWRFNCDPFYWRDMTAGWAGTYGADVVVDWPTNQYRKMATSLLAYRNAMQTGELSHDNDPRFNAAIANAHKHMQNFRDDLGQPMWVIQKERPDSPMKIDAAMAGCLSWEARMAAVAAGALEVSESSVMFV